MKMKFKNVVLGNFTFTLKDMLTDIEQQAAIDGDYKSDRNKMLKKINEYLEMII